MQPAYLACGGWIASAVGAAARLGVADHLAVGPKTAAELASLTGTSELVLLRVMRLLVAAGVFAEDEGRFRNTEDAATLLSDHPKSMRHFCILASGEYQRGFDELMYTLETGEPAFQKIVGGTIYEYMERSPEAAVVYDRAMEDLARPVGAALARARDFSGAGTVVDIGGGRGTLVKGLLRAVPHLGGLCFDRADVCDRARADLAATDPALAARLEYVAGDFFEHIPGGADVYLLKNVLHNWNDASCLRLLSSARAALDKPGASLLVIEPLADGAMPPMYRALDDLMQVVICEEGTTARSEEALRALLESSGFRVEAVTPLKSGHVAIEARRA